MMNPTPPPNSLASGALGDSPLGEPMSTPYGPPIWPQSNSNIIVLRCSSSIDQKALDAVYSVAERDRKPSIDAYT